MFSHCCLLFFRRGAAKLRLGGGGAQRLFLCANDQTSALNGPFGQIGSAMVDMPYFGHQLLCIFNFVLTILQEIQNLGQFIRRLFRQPVVSLPIFH
jgi:hypothetical protein